MTNGITIMEKWKQSQKQLKHLYLSPLSRYVPSQVLYVHFRVQTYAKDFKVSRRYLHNSKVFKTLKQNCHWHFFPSTVLWK